MALYHQVHHRQEAVRVAPVAVLIVQAVTVHRAIVRHRRVVRGVLLTVHRAIHRPVIVHLHIVQAHKAVLILQVRIAVPAEVH